MLKSQANNGSLKKNKTENKKKLILHQKKNEDSTLDNSTASETNNGAEFEDDMEPDAATAQSIGSAEGDQEDEQAASSGAIEFLKRLPGINEQNIYKVMTNVRSLYDLSQKSLEELKEICGKSNGSKLYEFLHMDSSTVE